VGSDRAVLRDGDEDAVARDVFRPAIAMGRGRVEIPPVFDADQVRRSSS
jgi:hypothetical protein